MIARESQVMRGYSAGLVMSLPLLDAGERRAAVRRSQADERRRTAQIRSLELEVTRQVNDAVANVDLAEEAVTQAEEDLRVSRLRFDVGRSLYLEVMDALTALSRARYNRVRALYAASVARADLLRATGRIDEERTR